MGGEVDGRADLYSSGCVAYWLLTGKHVFTAATAIALLMQHAQAEPPPPSTRTDQPISRALDELVLSCLVKEPGKRPQSARELSQRLFELEGAGEWTEEWARGWWARNLPGGEAVVR
ncbi:MAG TPA: hypothetical protein VGQ17_03680 [Gemmatimonadales bacterium]|jgi:serine/threonine-protein kinase|nr:hypothetical protein [Gemmatimonadales bacterium]